MSLRDEYAHMPEASRKNLFWFGVTMGIIFGVLGLLVRIRVLPSFGNWSEAESLWAVGVIFLAWALVAPMTLKTLYTFWMYLALTMGYVVSRLLLTILFYGIMTPMGLAMRLFGWDPLRLRPAKGEASYWRPRDAGALPKDHFERQY